MSNIRQFCDGHIEGAVLKVVFWNAYELCSCCSFIEERCEMFSVVFNMLDQNILVGTSTESPLWLFNNYAMTLYKSQRRLTIEYILIQHTKETTENILQRSSVTYFLHYEHTSSAYAFHDSISGEASSMWLFQKKSRLDIHLAPSPLLTLGNYMKMIPLAYFGHWNSTSYDFAHISEEDAL